MSATDTNNSSRQTATTEESDSEMQSARNLRAILDAYDNATPEEQSAQLAALDLELAALERERTRDLVQDATFALMRGSLRNLANERRGNTLFAVGMMAGLKHCPHCRKDVSPMSKCDVVYGIYHVDLCE